MTLPTQDHDLLWRRQTAVGRPAAVLLVGAPLVMAAGRVLLVPYDHQDWNGVLDAMAAHRGRSDGGWLLAVAASGLLSLTAALLSRRLHVSGRTGAAAFAAFAAVTTALGWAGCAGFATAALLVSVMAGAPDRPGQLQVMANFNDGPGNVVFLLALTGALGYAVLAYGLGRSETVSVGAAVLIGLGGSTTLLTMPGPVTPFLVLAAMLLTVGHALTLQPGRPATSSHDRTRP